MLRCNPQATRPVTRRPTEKNGSAAARVDKYGNSHPPGLLSDTPPSRPQHHRPLLTVDIGSSTRDEWFLHTASSPMRIHRQRRTCAQCAKAKRKCDKESPSCLRCVEKGIGCTYYPSRRNTRVFIPFSNPESALEIDSSVQKEDSDMVAVDTTVFRTVEPHATYASLPEPSSRSYPTLVDADTPLTCRWFLSPVSWTRQHGLSPRQGERDVSQKSLPHFIDKVKEWALTWVREGHSPIMHRQLYQDWMPECIEDAYSSLAAYHAASPRTKPTALRIIESRANKLVAQAQDDLAINEMSPAFLLDTPTHLARTQALFIYQLIRLFDGDIRSRAQAESHMGILNTWCRQMLESAQLDCSAADVFAATDEDQCADALTAMLAMDDEPLFPAAHALSTTTQANPPNINATTTFTDLSSINTTINTHTNTNFGTSTNPFSLPESTPPPTLHQAWLVSESIRRTYLAAIFTQVVYNNLKLGWSDCPGGLAFTAQGGLWDAEGGYAWFRMVRGLRKEGGAAAAGHGSRDEGVVTIGAGGSGPSPWLMVQSLESRGILERAASGEVDEFAVAVLEITYGVERVEQWRYEKVSD